MFNEKDIIIATLKKIETYLEKNKYDYEVIVIDDCSKDNSHYKVIRYIKQNKRKKMKIFLNKRNRGKGYSVARGLRYSKGDYFLMVDCDLSTPINELEKLMRYTKEYDFIVGSRYLKDSKVIKKQPILRRICGRVFNLLVNILFGLGVKDSQLGFKLYNRKARDLILKSNKINGYSFDVEHFVIFKLKGLKYKEVGVIWEDNKPKKARLEQIISMFSELIGIKHFEKQYRRDFSFQ